MSQPYPERGVSLWHVAGLAYCVGGLLIVAVAVASAFTQVSVPTALAGPLLVVAVLMAVPAIPACMLAQYSRYGRATLGARGVSIPLRGPYRVAAVVVFAPLVFVLLAVFIGHAASVWNRGGWALVVGGWPALVFIAAVAVIEKQAWPSAWPAPPDGRSR